MTMLEPDPPRSDPHSEKSDQNVTDQQHDTFSLVNELLDSGQTPLQVIRILEAKGFDPVEVDVFVNEVHKRWKINEEYRKILKQSGHWRMLSGLVIGVVGIAGAISMWATARRMEDRFYIIPFAVVI